MTTKTPSNGTKAGSLALALLFAGLARALPASAALSNGPLEGKGTSPARIPGLPTLAIQSADDMQGPALGDAASSSRQPLDPTSLPVESDIPTAAQRADLTLPATAIAAPLFDAPSHGASVSPAAAQAGDLGDISPAPQGDFARRSAPEAAEQEPSGVAGTAGAVFAAVARNPAVQAIAAGVADAGASLRRLYEAAEGKDGADSVAAAGAAFPAAEAFLDSLGFDGLRAELLFIPDAWAISPRDMARTVGPAAAALIAEEIAARKSPRGREAAARPSEAWSRYRAAVDGAKAAANEFPPRKEEQRMAVWRALWRDGEFQAAVREAFGEGRFTPLEYRRILLGLDVNKGFAKQRLGELAAAFSEAYHEDAGLTWVDRRRAVAAVSAMKKEHEGFAKARQEAARFDALSETVKAFGPRIEEAMDLVLLAAPAGAEVPAYVREVLEKTARILRPALRGGLTSFEEEDARQLFFETLLKVLFPDYRLEIRVGLGGSNDSPSIRMFSYVIPALDQLRAFARNGARPPRLIVLNAQAISQDVNGLDPVRSRRNAELANDALLAFVRRFYPDVAGSVSIEMRSLEEIRRHPLDENVEHLRTLSAQEPASADAKTRQLLNDLAKMRKQAVRHGEAGDETQAAESALVYAAAHPGPGVFGDIQLAEGLNAPGGRPPQGVIEYGGDGERSFKRLQAYLAGRHPTASAGSRTYLTNTAFGAVPTDGGAPSPARARGILGRMEVGGKPPYYHPDGGGFPEITLVDPRRQLAAQGITTAQGLVDYYRRHFTRAFDNNGRPDVDRSIPFDVEALAAAVGGPELLRFLSEFEPG